MEKDPEMVLETFNWEKAPCLTCSWAYVLRCKPQMRCCGKYGIKPAGIYYNGDHCPNYRGLPELPKGMKPRQ